MAEEKRGFKFPSTYTILFILIIIVAIATWIVPAGQYEVNEAGEPLPGSYHNVDSNPQRIITDGLMAIVNGTYGIQAEDGTISVYNLGDLYGAIDVAFFVLVIGGFLAVTMATGAIDAGIPRGLSVLMTNGLIVDTVLYWAESALTDVGGVIFTNFTHLLYLPLGFLIPSSSGLATVTMPIMAPLADFAAVDRSLLVTASNTPADCSTWSIQPSPW